MLRHQPPGRPVQRPLIVPFDSDVVTSIKPIKKRHRRTVMRGSATRLHLPGKPAPPRKSPWTWPFRTPNAVSTTSPTRTTSRGPATPVPGSTTTGTSCRTCYSRTSTVKDCSTARHRCVTKTPRTGSASSARPHPRPRARIPRLTGRARRRHARSSGIRANSTCGDQASGRVVNQLNRT